jgi:hypothetical protein
VEVALANPPKLAFAAFAVSAAKAVIAAETVKAFLLACVYTLEVSRQIGS